MSKDKARSEGVRIGCPSCGSGLRYDIASGKLQCANCDNQYEINQIQDLGKDDPEGIMEGTVCTCPQCGAELQAAQTDSVSFCAFCGSNVVLTQRLSKFRRPSRIMPFRITREECEEIYRKHLEGANYVPSDLLKQETISHFQPVYIPFWEYKASAEGEAEGSATEKSTEDGYIYDRAYDYKIKYRAFAENLSYDASTLFDDDIASRLAFHSSTQPFHAGFLCGCCAQAPDVDQHLYDAMVYDKMQHAVAGRSPIQVKTPDPVNKAELVLKPVWLLANRQGGRMLYTAVNGSTGEIVCDTPPSIKSFSLLAAFVTVLLFVLLLLLNRFLILRPKTIAMFSGVICAIGCWMGACDTKIMIYMRTHDTDLTRRMLRHLQEKKSDSTPRRSAQKTENRIGIVEKAYINLVLIGWLIGLGNLLANGRNNFLFPYILAGAGAFYLLSLLFIHSPYNMFRRSMNHGHLLWRSELLIAGAAAVVFIIWVCIISRNANEIVANLVSNTSAFPSFMLAISAISVYKLILYVDGSYRDAWPYIGLLACMVIGVVLMLFPKVVLGAYLYSTVLTAIMCAGMIWQFRWRRNYFTRPVPFFGKEDGK